MEDNIFSLGLNNDIDYLITMQEYIVCEVKKNKDKRMLSFQEDILDILKAAKKMQIKDLKN